MQIYLITNLINGKQYVGQTSQPLRGRWSHHLSSARQGEQTYLYNAIRQHGGDNFSIAVLHSCQSKEEMDFAETFYISFLSTMRPHGYNLKLGGDGSVGYKHTKEAIEKMCRIQQANPTMGMLGKKHRPETITLLSLRAKNRKNRPHTEETKRKMSAAALGRKRAPFSKEWRDNLSISQKRRWKVQNAG